MSNHLAIATVTATLGGMLARAARVVPAAEVTHLFPGDQNLPAAGTNLYLYQVSSNPALRSPGMPVRNPNPRAGQPPSIPLDLHYLLSFTGDETRLEPQRLLGATVALLHANPLLTREMFMNTIQVAVALDPAHFLAASDLADQVDGIRLIPLPLSLQELADLWRGFQAPYRLSVAYQASVVWIQPQGEEKWLNPDRLDSRGSR